jgi:hypothetical protein
MTFPVVLLAFASLASLASLIWLIVVAFQNGEKNWGIALIVSSFIPLAGPIVALIFVVKFWGIARKPAFLFLGSILLLGMAGLAMANSLRKMGLELGDNPDFQITLNGPKDPLTRAPQDEAGNGGLPSEERPKVTADPAAPLSPPPEPSRIRRTPPTARPMLPSEERPSAASEATPPTPPPLADNRFSPLAIDLISMGDPNPNQIRTLHARARNTSTLAVREARLSLSYYNERGLRLGRWTTTHIETTNMVPALTTNEFSFQAFFVPQFTKNVQIEVESIRYANGERWPPIDPTLARPQ